MQIKNSFFTNYFNELFHKKFCLRYEVYFYFNNKPNFNSNNWITCMHNLCIHAQKYVNCLKENHPMVF